MVHYPSNAHSGLLGILGPIKIYYGLFWPRFEPTPSTRRGRIQSSRSKLLDGRLKVTGNPKNLSPHAGLWGRERGDGRDLRLLETQARRPRGE